TSRRPRPPRAGCTGSSRSSRRPVSCAVSVGPVRFRTPSCRSSTAWAACCRRRERWFCLSGASSEKLGGEVGGQRGGELAQQRGGAGREARARGEGPVVRGKHGGVVQGEARTIGQRAPQALG